MIDLRARWATIAKPDHVDWTWRILSACYRRRFGFQDGRVVCVRAYHNLDHIAGCLEMLDRLVDRRIDRRMAELALWWHDAVYVAGSATNEEQSAALMTGLRDALACDLREINWARRCILATRHANSWQFVGNPTVDAVLDIDLSILGAEPWRYRSYAASIREEFAAIEDSAWREGRGAFLRGMLARETLFLGDAMREWFEFAARENMRAELAELGAPEVARVPDLSIKKGI